MGVGDRKTQPAQFAEAHPAIEAQRAMATEHHAAMDSAVDHLSTQAPAPSDILPLDGGGQVGVGDRKTPPAQFAEAHPAIAAQRAMATKHHAAMDTAVDKLATHAAPALQKRIDELYTILHETGDLKLFAQRLAELAAAEPDGELTQALERAGFTARLLGRSL